MLLLTFFFRSNVYADDLPGKSTTEDQIISNNTGIARTFFEQGINSFDDGDYNQALEFFMRALALTSAKEHPEIPHNIAITLRKLRRNDEALAYDSMTFHKTANILEQLQSHQHLSWEPSIISKIDSNTQTIQLPKEISPVLPLQSNGTSLWKSLYHPNDNVWYLWFGKYALYLIGICLLLLVPIYSQESLGGGYAAMIIGYVFLFGGFFV
jgi:tetratricopeptide (TPR) repeat protein